MPDVDNILSDHEPNGPGAREGAVLLGTITANSKN